MGLTAGASAPDVLITEVIDAFRARYDVTVASPDGGPVAVDALSDPRDPSRWSADDVISMGYLNMPEVIARKRAEAMKAYLVTDRGVDEARVTARGAGADRPLDRGTSAAARARNRRVDVIFLPEGATAPDID